jgi:hypothetical protein
MNEIIIAGFIILILVGGVFIVAAVLFLIFYYKKTRGNAMDKIDLVRENYHPNMSGTLAIMRATKAEKRISLLKTIHEEVSLLTDSMFQESAAKQAHYRNQDTWADYQLQRDREMALHDAFIAEAINRKIVADIGSRHGIPADSVKELVLETFKMQSVMMMESFKMQLDVNNKRQTKQIDFDFQNQMASLDAQMANVQHLLPQYLLNDLYKQLSSVHMEYESVNRLPDGDFKRREIKRVEGRMKSLQQNINERERNI